jgi:hypothetical protein
MKANSQVTLQQILQLNNVITIIYHLLPGIFRLTYTVFVSHTGVIYFAVISVKMGHISHSSSCNDWRMTHMTKQDRTCVCPMSFATELLTFKSAVSSK